MSSNSYETGYRWYVCYEQHSHRLDNKKYECIKSTFEEAVNPSETGRFVFIPAYVPAILDTVVIKTKLADSITVKIQE
jgi:hypothetical protein